MMGTTQGARTTPEMLALLRRLGLRVSPEQLRIDVHRGLLSPVMPDTHHPARGTVARWTHMGERRAVYLYRLRKLGVNGRALPLLLWLRDGWGWEHILPTLQDAIRRVADAELKALNKPNRARSMPSLLDNVKQDETWRDYPHPDAVLSWREWLRSLLVFGRPAPGTSPVDFITQSLPDLLGLEITLQQQAQWQQLARMDQQSREAMGVPLRGMPDWLATLDSAAVEKGRRFFLVGLRELRRHSWQHRADFFRDNPTATSTNPLTLGGLPAPEITALFRQSPGRITAAQGLAACIVQSMTAGTLILERLALAASSRTVITEEPPRRLQPSGGMAHGKEPSACAPTLPRLPTGYPPNP